MSETGDRMGARAFVKRQLLNFSGLWVVGRLMDEVEARLSKALREEDEMASGCICEGTSCLDCDRREADRVEKTVSGEEDDAVGPSLQTALQNRAEIKARVAASTDPARGPDSLRDPADVAELNRLRAVEADLLNECERLRGDCAVYRQKFEEMESKWKSALDANARYVAEVKGLREDRTAAELREASAIRERDEARREHAASEQRRENEVANLHKELDETKTELARELGVVRQRYSAGNILIDCGVALDASSDDCRSREGIWFPDGKGTKLCYRCLVRLSHRLLEELRKLEKTNDGMQEARNAAYIASLGPKQDLEDRVKGLEERLEMLRAVVEKGLWK